MTILEGLKEMIQEITIEVINFIILLGVIIFSSIVYHFFIEENDKSYIATISVKSKKIDGKSWDIRGGYPDILLKLNREKSYFDKSCKDKYKCIIQFESSDNSWYVEVYDKDLVSNDIIGNGTCKVNKTCEIGLAKVFIKELNFTPTSHPNFTPQ